MALSNSRAYFKRKYFKNGEWKEESEYECCQLNQSSSWSDGYYRMYRENAPLTGGWSQINYSSIGDAVYAAYEPGKVFMSKKYYRITDLFPASTLSGLKDFISDLMETDLKLPSGKTQYGRTFLPNTDEIFWQSESGNNLYFYFNVYFDYSTSYRTWRVTIDLCYSVIKCRPSQLFVDYDAGNYTYGKTLYYDESGVAAEPQVSEAGNGTIFKVELTDHPTNVPARPKPDQVLEYYNRFYSQLLLMRFYILYNNSGEQMAASTYDGSAYFTKKTTVGQNKFIFMMDVREVPYFPTGGFIILGQNPVTNFLSKITTSGGPDPNDPYEEDDPYDEDPGDEDGGGDGDFDDTDDDIPKPSIPPLSASGASLITIYNPSSSQLQTVANKLWSQDFLEVFKQYFTSPMEAILGLAIIPVNPSTATSKNVYLGAYDTGVSAPVVDSDYVIIDCGNVPISRYWGSYLDYDPYTKISCYLPYIGEIDINPDQVMQKSLGIYYYVNVVTGDIVAVLTADGSVFATAAGNCVRQLPIAQQDYSAIINTAVAAVGVLATAGVAGAAGAGAAAASGMTLGQVTAPGVRMAGAINAMAMSSPSLISNAVNTKKHYQHAGQIGSGSGQLAPQKPFLTIERPNLDLADNYKSFVGYPCNKTLQLGACHGFTQIESTRLSIPSAIDEEIAEVVELLTKGVII